MNLLYHFFVESLLPFVLVTIVTHASSVLAQQVTDPCNEKIAFASTRDFNGNGEIYVMNSDGSNPVRLTTHSAIDLKPSWSPDGTMIAFQSDRDNLGNGRSDIYVMKADGTNVMRLTTDAGFDEAPSWSPLGNKIAFLSSRDDPMNNARQLYVMNSDGSNQIRLTFGGPVQPGVSWSPDGSKIAFSALFGTTADDILIINAAGGTPVRFTEDARDEGRPAWSPDGMQIAYALNGSGPGQLSEIVVMNTDHTNFRNLTQSPNRDDESPAWSSDGSAIAFISSTGFESQEIYVMYPDGSGQVNLTNNPASDYSPAWQANQSPAPCLLQDLGSTRTAALDSVTFVRDPFTVVSNSNFSQDGRKRVSLFTRNLKLLAGETSTVVTARIEDAQHVIYQPEVEFVGVLPGFPWLTQVNVKLPAGLPAGNVQISLLLRGIESNRKLIAIAP